MAPDARLNPCGDNKDLHKGLPSAVVPPLVYLKQGLVFQIAYQKKGKGVTDTGTVGTRGVGWEGEKEKGTRRCGIGNRNTEAQQWGGGSAS